MQPSTYKKELAKIHLGKKAMGLSDDDYRAFLLGLTNKDSSKSMTQAQRLRVIAEMRNKGAFKKAKKPLTGQQKACVAKWYKLRSLGAINSKDKTSLNKFINQRFTVWNVWDLDTSQTNQLLGMLQGWIDKVEHTVGEQPIIDGDE